MGMQSSGCFLLLALWNEHKIYVYGEMLFSKFEMAVSECTSEWPSGPDLAQDWSASGSALAKRAKEETTHSTRRSPPKCAIFSFARLPGWTLTWHRLVQPFDDKAPHQLDDLHDLVYSFADIAVIRTFNQFETPRQNVLVSSRTPFRQLHRDNVRETKYRVCELWIYIRPCIVTQLTIIHIL